MKQTLIFKSKPVITGYYSIGGPKESNGVIAKYLDKKLSTDTIDEKSFEKAESKMIYMAINGAIEKANKKDQEINAVIAGDLVNQIICSSFAVRNLKVPFLGIYNACATFAEAIAIGSTFLEANQMENIVCASCSHFSTAERQYRYPLELGSTRPPLSQWTVTGAGALVISKKGDGPRITSSTIGKVIDFGITDANNMGAAMAPAAADTICAHFKEMDVSPNYYDLIITGDLGTFGSRILKDLVWEKGYDIENQHVDCGELVFNINEKEYQGASGAGCSSMVFCSYLIDKLIRGKVKKVLLVCTGALLSSLSSQQGESIPSIAHAVSIEA